MLLREDDWVGALARLVTGKVFSALLCANNTVCDSEQQPAENCAQALGTKLIGNRYRQRQCRASLAYSIS